MRLQIQRQPSWRTSIEDDAAAGGVRTITEIQLSALTVIPMTYS